MTEAASSHIAPGFCLSRAVAIPARIILASGILPRGLVARAARMFSGQ